VKAEVSWDYHRGAKESGIQVLNPWFVSVSVACVVFIEIIVNRIGRWLAFE
jgi:hypothetical protein